MGRIWRGEWGDNIRKMDSRVWWEEEGIWKERGRREISQIYTYRTLAGSKMEHARTKRQRLALKNLCLGKYGSRRASSTKKKDNPLAFSNLISLLINLRRWKDTNVNWMKRILVNSIRSYRADTADVYLTKHIDPANRYGSTLSRKTKLRTWTIRSS